jgi:hypothetical protein
VSLPEIAGLLWRHLLAVLAVLIVAAGVAYTFKHTPPTYAETATLVFVPPHSGAHPNPLEASSGSILESAGTIAVQVMSPQGQQRVRAAGGTAQIDVELVNSYNLEYPDYSNPYLTVTTTSADFPAVHRTFTAVNKVLNDEFMAEEVQNDVTPNNQIQIVMAGDTGPLTQTGSSKRTLGGLIILTIVAIFAVAAFFDRHPVRLMRSGRRTPEPRPSQMRIPRLQAGDPASFDY